MRIEVDREKCVGLGLCEAVTEEYFEVLDDGSLAILREDIDPADVAVVKEAVLACPTKALRLVE